MERKVIEAKSLEEAKQMACEQFNLPESQITFNVLYEKKDMFGSIAKMMVEAVVGAEIDGIAKGKDYLMALLRNNNIQGYVDKKVRGSNVQFDIDAGKFNGYLIGKNAKTLMALQILVSNVVNKYYDKVDEKTVLVDVGGYKRRRQQILERMAVENAKEVVRTGVEVTLDYLNAYERKIVHNKLSTWKEVETYSEGKEPNRFLHICLKQEGVSHGDSDDADQVDEEALVLEDTPVSEDNAE